MANEVGGRTHACVMKLDDAMTGVLRDGAGEPGQSLQVPVIVGAELPREAEA